MVDPAVEAEVWALHDRLRPGFLALARTLLAYRALPPAQRQEMHDTLERIIDGHGGAIEIELATVLALGRRG